MRRLGIHDGDVQTGILLKKYIDKNLFSVLGLKALEQRFKLTDATVQKAFKSLFGQTLATYVLEKRLMVAFDQILVSTDTLTDIGKGCGLTNKNLIANFQQRYGTTTRGVRRRGERIFPE